MGGRTQDKTHCFELAVQHKVHLCDVVQVEGYGLLSQKGSRGRAYK